MADNEFHFGGDILDDVDGRSDDADGFNSVLTGGRAERVAAVEVDGAIRIIS